MPVQYLIIITILSYRIVAIKMIIFFDFLKYKMVATHAAILIRYHAGWCSNSNWKRIELIKSTQYLTLHQFEVIVESFDPDYECHSKTRPASNKTPDERMAYLVVIV